ncbi:MAG: DUF4878 domain-containing protein [Chitinophagaceae bacterium]|nr:DUF4878 domain-containing protein [Chitinophagaceae bacterium]MCO5285991.1 DUF4878 domain-containing protein [Chitinophagaceae bacterium]MCZ2395155.1 DUF4878 domain-containing protein [Chitinophagales bacterium]
MKKLLIFAPALLFILGACNSLQSGKSPSEVLAAFFDAISQKNIPEAKKLVTQDSEGMISMMELSLRGLDTPDSSMDQFNKDKIKIGDTRIDGDNATVSVTEKASGEAINFYLKKESGQWKVAFDMATLLKMAKDKMGEKGVIPDSTATKALQEGIDKLGGSMDSLNEMMKNIDPKKIDQAAKLLDSISKNIPADKMKEVQDAIKKMQQQ